MTFADTLKAAKGNGYYYDAATDTHLPRMLAIIGNGEEVETQPVIACEYNMKTGIATLLLADMSKTEVDTKVDRVAIATDGVVYNRFNGEVI